MSWEDFLGKRPLAVVATVSPDGLPHAVPVEVIVHEGRVYVWTQHASAKARNASRARAAALTAYKGHAFVMVRGPARLLDASDARYARITQSFLEKYDREETYGNDVLIEIEPARVVSERIE